MLLTSQNSTYFPTHIPPRVWLGLVMGLGSVVVCAIMVPTTAQTGHALWPIHRALLMGFA